MCGYFYFSGGIPLSVQGRHLAAVSEPKVVVYVNNRQFTNVSLAWLSLLYLCIIITMYVEQIAIALLLC